MSLFFPGVAEGEINRQRWDLLAGMFPLVTEQLADGVAFSQKSRLDVVTSGLQTGSDGFLSASWSNLMQVNYTTPATTMQGILLWQVRIDNLSAVWDWSETRVQSSPEPVGQLKAFGAPSTLWWTHSAGQASVHHIGFDYVRLAANTLYPFIVQARQGPSANQKWTALPEHAVMGIFWQL